MDALSSLLLALKVNATIVSRWELTAPWGIDVQDFEPAYCICVMDGRCWFEAPGYALRCLEPGDWLLATGRGACQLRSQPGVAVASLGTVWGGDRFVGFTGETLAVPATLRWGGGGMSTRLLGLAFEFGAAPGLLAELPAFLILSQAQSASFPGIRAALDQLANEEEEARPGYLAVANHLAELVFVSLLRAHVLTHPPTVPGRLRGLTDSRIGTALSAIHAQPGHSWSVPALAAKAGMSRSAFAKRFAELVGRAPMEYLVDWRVQLAAQALSEGRQPLDRLAQRLGFESDDGLRRAFRQRMGMPPARWRRSMAAREGND